MIYIFRKTSSFSTSIEFFQRTTFEKINHMKYAKYREDTSSYASLDFYGVQNPETK